MKKWMFCAFAIGALFGGKMEDIYEDVSLYGSPILRHKAALVEDVNSPYVKQAISHLIEKASAIDCAGLAAPQLGYPLSIFINSLADETCDPDHVYIDSKGRPKQDRYEVMINFKILSFSEETFEDREACVSLGPIAAQVKRPETIEFEYMNEKGALKKGKATGWRAKCLQHEYDHTIGKLFYDYLDEDERKRVIDEIEAYFSNLSLK